MNRSINRHKKQYAARMNFWSEMTFALSGVFLCAVIFCTGHALAALLLLTALACAINPLKARTCAVTLSVPEILMDVLDAFKLETPELFGPTGFATDFSSKTAVLGDKITSRISHVPVTAAYDPTPGRGFYAGAQSVTSLIEDVPVTLDSLIHVPIKVGWLTQLASKLPRYKEAIRNYGFALAKAVIDTALAKVSTSFSNTILLPPPLANLDSLELVRDQLNSQKAADRGRFGLVNSALAEAIGADDRVRNSLFYGQLNGEQGFRRWKNLAGCAWVSEYPDIANDAAPYIGFFGDRRSITVATRRPDFANAAEELGVPQIMDFYPMQDDESGLFILGVAWQEVGTGDVYVSAAVLFGASAGNQAGAPGSGTDNAGLLVRSV